jgi:serine/threonine protein kinase
MIGRSVGHYTVTEKLGEGGMGVVYKARDTHLDRFVAIKVLPPERVADPGRKARFVLEAKTDSGILTRAERPRRKCWSRKHI